MAGDGGAVLDTHKTDRHSPCTDEDMEFQAFARSQEPRLLTIALRLCGNEADARDLVQDTFERALRHAERILPGASGRSWLTTTLNNLFVDFCRRHRAKALGEPQL